MKTNQILPCAILSVACGLSITASQAATLTSGYIRDVNGDSQLLIANGGAGQQLFGVDGAQTGGADLVLNNGIPAFGWVVAGPWFSGDNVEFTGLALPLWSSGEATTNNTQSGTFTFSFYSAGTNNDWEGLDNLGISDDSLIGTIDLTFAAGSINAYYANFDSPLEWTADSPSVLVTFVHTGAVRLKFGPTGTAVTRENRLNGTSIAAGSAFSLAGTVIPEPTTALLGSLGLLALLRRRRA